MIGFQAMIKAMKVGDDDKHAMLTHYVGTEVRKLMKKLPDPTGENMPTDAYEKVKGKLDEYFAPKMNRVYLMNSLHQVRQNTGETIRQLPHEDTRKTGSTQPGQNDNHGTNRADRLYRYWSTIAQITTSERRPLKMVWT